MTERHWTQQSADAFLYSIASDFVEQLRAKLRKLEMSQSELARAANVSKSYVSQVFKDPGNLSLITIVKFAQAVDMNVSLVGYEKLANDNGPINPEMFRICWERMGRPVDMWSLDDRKLDLAKPANSRVRVKRAGLTDSKESKKPLVLRKISQRRKPVRKSTGVSGRK